MVGLEFGLDAGPSLKTLGGGRDGDGNWALEKSGVERDEFSETSGVFEEVVRRVEFLRASF